MLFWTCINLTVNDTLRDCFVAARRESNGLEAARVLASVQEQLFATPAEPVSLGRFVILKRLGSGGMGVVYLGYDGELDRNVALKVLRARADGELVTQAARERLVSEARAVARVEHPNVVAIYEVGTDGEVVYLAMERVDGVTLAKWQRQHDASSQILEVYLQAGRGLAAAHAAGVVHRDFKPQNVLISKHHSGGVRARVVDFGLACSDAETPADTATQAKVGTPAYMAPEQIRGGAVDARSDQFSFALALYEGLAGERAFVGETMEAFHAAVLAGRRRPFPRTVPTWLRRILNRALACEPEARYPGMPEMLREIEQAAGAQRRRRAGVGIVGLTVAAGFVGYTTASPAACRGGADAVAEVWNQQTAQQIEQAFASSQKPYAETAWTQTQVRLDAYANEWVEMRDDACAATHVRGEQSTTVLDLRMACLDRRHHELAALIDVLQHADERPELITKAVEASVALTPVAGCADREALTGPEALPEDPRIRTRVAQLRRELINGKALRDAGRYEEGLAIAREAVDAADELGYRPLQAEAALLEGTLLGLMGRADDAGIAFDRSFTAGLASGHSEVAMWSAVHATHVVGVIGRDGFAGRRWAHLAAPLVTRMGEPDHPWASLEANLGNIAVVQGELDEASERFGRALARADNADLDILTAKTSANLAAVYRRQGNYQKALASYRRAEQLFTANFGPTHPFMATFYNNLGALYQTMGDLQAAEDNYRLVLSLAGSSISTTSSTVGHANNNLGEVLLARDQPGDAAEHFGTAIAVWESLHGADYPLLAHPLLGLGRALRATDQPEEAVVALERALKLRTASQPAKTEEIQKELDSTRAMLPTPEAVPEGVPGRARGRARGRG